MITYTDQTKAHRARIAVRIDGRLAGHIKGTFDQRFAYTPKGAKFSGSSFRTIEQVKASIEGKDAIDREFGA